MSGINHFKVLYHARLFDKWYNVDLVINKWYKYITYQENNLQWVIEI
jgi:hypothetical protein